MTRAVVSPAAPFLAGGDRRAAGIVIGSGSPLVVALVRVVALVLRHAVAVPAAPRLITALVEAAAGCARPGLAASPAPHRGPSGGASPPAGAHGRPLTAIANITLI